jgi:hypothetical protein
VVLFSLSVYKILFHIGTTFRHVIFGLQFAEEIICEHITVKLSILYAEALSQIHVALLEKGVEFNNGEGNLAVFD